MNTSASNPVTLTSFTQWDDLVFDRGLYPFAADPLVQHVAWVPAPLDQVFDFFSDPNNLVPLMPKFLEVEVPEGLAKSKKGDHLDLGVSLLGAFEIPWHVYYAHVWKSANHGGFVDLRMPADQFEPFFRRFCHMHTFIDVKYWDIFCKKVPLDFKPPQSSGTVIFDWVRWQPSAPTVVHDLINPFIQRALSKLFVQREKFVKKLWVERKQNSTK